MSRRTSLRRRLVAVATLALVTTGVSILPAAATPAVATAAPIVMRIDPSAAATGPSAGASIGDATEAVVSGKKVARTLTQVLKQPDGSSFRATLTEDALGGLFETPQGYSVARNDARQWVYVKGIDENRQPILTSMVARDGLVPVGIAQHAGRASAKQTDEVARIRASMLEQLRRASYQAQAAATAAGTPRVFKVPALMLATWYDEAAGQTSPQFEAGHDAAFYKKILDGFGGNPTGSVTEFYFEGSFGQFLVEIDVYGPYTSARSIGDPCYYGAGDGSFRPTDPTSSVLGMGGLGAAGMTLEAVPQAAADVSDWSQYDNDGDGQVDFTIIIHSGSDAASTGNTCFTWSHAMEAMFAGNVVTSVLGLPSDTFGPLGIPTSTPGVFVNRVVTIPEKSSYTSPLTIGVAAHEMAHALGEPDYYDVNYTSNGTGDFDIMSGGSYMGNPAGSNPTLFNPATRVFQGWLTPTIVKKGTNLRGYRLEPRNVLPKGKPYTAGTPDPNLLLVPTFEVAVGDTDNLGHTWTEEDVHGLAKDGNKYVVEGFYVELVNRTAKGPKLNPASAQGAMFDRLHHGSGILVWHFDYWTQSTTLYGHDNDAQSEPNRYQMDVEEFDANDTTQELQLNLTRGGPEDYLGPAATGITSGTFTGAAAAATSTAPATKQDDVTFSGTATPVVGGTSTFTVEPGNGAMKVSVTGMGDCTLSLTDPSGKQTQVVDSESVGAAESITVDNPSAGTWTANVGDFLLCGSYEGTATFSAKGTSGSDGFSTKGAAGTWSNWSQAPTGWAFTNVRGATNGLDSSVEAGGDGSVTLDVQDLAGRVDVSPGFIKGTASVRRQATLSVPIFSNGSKAPGTVAVRIREGSTTGRILATKTVTLGAYTRKTVAFPYTAKLEGPAALVVTVDPTNRLAEANEQNNTQATLVMAGPQSPTVGIVDDDGSLVHEQAIAGALSALGVRYGYLPSSPSLAQLRAHKAIIWSTGLERGEGQLSANDRKVLSQYLDGGGKVLFNGNRLLDAVNLGDAAFAAGYLGTGAGTVLSQESATDIAGSGVLAAAKVTKLRVPAGRPFITAAPLATSGVLGTVSAVAAPDRELLADNGVAAGSAYVGTAVTGDAAHKRFQTVALGFNIADAVSARSIETILTPVLKRFGVPLAAYTYTGNPRVLINAPRDTVKGSAIVVSGIVLGKVTPGTVKLYYRKHGTGSFRAVTMAAKGGRVYEATIPSSYATAAGVEYYIKAGSSLAPARTGAGSLYYSVAIAPNK